MKWRVTHYFDVWGNERDGWQVNDSRVAGIVYLPEGASDGEILSVLVRDGYLKSSRGVQVVDIGPGYLEIVKRDGFPLYGLDEVEV